MLQTRRSNNRVSDWFAPLCVVVAVLTAFYVLAPSISQSVSYMMPTTAPAPDVVVLENGDLLVPPHTTLSEDLALALLPDPSFPSHAVMRHGLDAMKASECNASNYSMRFYNPQTKRTAFVCQIDDFFGVHILEETMEEVTAFIKNKMTKASQVLKYMQNAGYELLH